MKTALLLIDVQHDYLHSKLSPPAADLIPAWKALLALCRAQEISIYHVRTQVLADGSNAMPHRREAPACVVGTPGSEAPTGLEALSGETVLVKPFFSAFGNPDLAKQLMQTGVQRLLIAGVYTEACIRASVLDAYQAGFKGVLIEDALGSQDPLHAELSLNYLRSRTCQTLTLKDLQQQYGPEAVEHSTFSTLAHAPQIGPAYYRGQWQATTQHQRWQVRNPGQWSDIQAELAVANAVDVDQAIDAIQHSRWCTSPLQKRISIIEHWHRLISEDRSHWIEDLAVGVGKPYLEADQEVSYALRLIESTLTLLQQDLSTAPTTDQSFTLRYQALGRIALITPWNNPLAIPIGKLAPALGFGNTVIWKPALQAPQIVERILRSLAQAGLPNDCLAVVNGGAATARAVAQHPLIHGVSFTGSVTAGQSLAPLCALTAKSFQAELGGNNAVIISRTSNLPLLAQSLARQVYSFAGQRCTAPRRLIVLSELVPAFTRVFVAETRRLKMGLAQDPHTDIGPLISRTAQERMQILVEESISAGAHLLCGGKAVNGSTQGCWFEPTLLSNASLNSTLVQEEAFGPVAVLLPAENFKAALEICNAVEYGLVASLYSDDREEQALFAETAQAGILRINQAQGIFDPQAPFGGWKQSGIGLPEHGKWDRDFYTRPQAVYS